MTSHLESATVASSSVKALRGTAWLDSLKPGTNFVWRGKQFVMVVDEEDEIRCWRISNGAWAFCDDTGWSCLEYCFGHDAGDLCDATCTVRPPMVEGGK